jgi:hypothetical protein
MSAQTRDQLGRIVKRWSKAVADILPLQRLGAHPIATTSTTALALLLGFILRRDYQTYISMGPGGLPHNVVGWLASTLLLRPLTLGRDVRSTKPYNESREQSYLPEQFPPRREGTRPIIGPHPVPHRQLNQLPAEHVKKELVRRVSEIAAAAVGRGLAVLKQSNLERHTEALFVAEHRSEHVTQSAAAAANGIRGEFAHVHETGDHSLHMVLSPTDCTLEFPPTCPLWQHTDRK